MRKGKSVEKRLAHNLRKWREVKNLTQSDVSKITGITEVSISRYETEERIPKATTAYVLAKCYGVSMDRLYD